MSLALPDQLVVEVTCDDGSAAIVEGLLIFLDCQHEGRYYYGSLVGLTDADGVARITREAIEGVFAEERRDFPMDYRLPLTSCDARIVVRLVGGAEFAAAADVALRSDSLRDEARALWRRARNTRVVGDEREAVLSAYGPAANVILHTKLASTASVRPQ